MLLPIRICCEIAATVLVTAALVHWLGTGWHTFLIAVAGMAVVLYVVAGIAPRMLGRQYEGRLGRGRRHPLPGRAGARAAAAAAARGRQRADPGTGRQGRRAESEEELRGLVDLLGERRVIEPGERAMIHSVFELGDTIVREVMVPRTDIVFVERDKNVRQVLSLALRSGFSRIPVVGENKDDVFGIAYLKDLVRRTRAPRKRRTVKRSSR